MKRLLSPLLKIKSAATEVTAQKTQTPIVAKPINVKRGVNAPIQTSRWNLHFYQIQLDICITKRKRNYIFKNKIHPFSHLFNWFSIFSLSQILSKCNVF